MRAHNIVSLSVVTLLIIVLFTGATTTLVAAQSTPAPTIYYVPQAGSTWVNQGTAGASYNAYVSTPSLFQTQSNGHPYWGTIGQNDFIGIPAGTATNNQNVVSWEIGFHFAGPVPGERFQKIWDKAYGGFMLEIDTNYGANHCELTLYRATTGGSGARWYIPTTTPLRAGHNYYIQISWDTSAGPGHESYPTIWIGEDGKAPVLQTSWDESGGALSGTGSWYNDAVGGANLGNTASDGNSITSVKTAWLNGGFFVYRQYNSIVDFSNGGNWASDKLAWTTATPTIKPTATPAPKVTATPTPTVVKAAATPTVVKAAATPTVVKAAATPTVVKAAATPTVVKAAATPTVVKAAATPTVVKAAATPTVVKAAATPTVVKAAATPTVVKAAATPTVVKAAATPTVVKAAATPTVVKAAATPTVVKAAATPSLQATQLAPVTTGTTNAAVPGIAVPTEQASAQTSSVASLPPQPVGEFSLLGLGIPALVVGAIYILMRKG